MTKKPESKTAKAGDKNQTKSVTKTEPAKKMVGTKNVIKTKKTPFIDLVHNDNTWRAKDREKKEVLVESSTKDIALKEARRVAKELHAELVIHNKNGKISDRRSYGNDPKGNG